MVLKVIASLGYGYSPWLFEQQNTVTQTAGLSLIHLEHSRLCDEIRASIRPWAAKSERKFLVKTIPVAFSAMIRSELLIAAMQNCCSTALDSYRCCAGPHCTWLLQQTPLNPDDSWLPIFMLCSHLKTSDTGSHIDPVEPKQRTLWSCNQT